VPRSIQAVEPGSVGACPEVVQVDICRRDRRVPHPGLHGAGINTAGEPQAGRRVPQVVDPPASGDDRPVEGALDRGRVQHVPGGGDEQRRVRLSPGSHRPDQGERPVGPGTRRDRPGRPSGGRGHRRRPRGPRPR